MRYAVRSDDGREVEVDAVDWMLAMVRATELLAVVPSSLHYLPRPDGTVEVRDASHRWTVIPLETGQEPGRTPTVPPRAPTPLAPPDRALAMVPPRARPYRSPLRKPMWSPDRATDASGPGGTALPRPEEGSAGWVEPPPNLAERLLELSAEIRAQRDARAAAARALQIALALVPCEAGSVLRGGADDEQLEFFVVQGGAGASLTGRRVPFHKGIAGACYDSGVSIRVDDVAQDPRHNTDIDRDTGFVTRSVLCVPVRSEHGFHGVIELLNPRGTFLGWHVDVVESLAAALAETVAGR